MHQGVMPCIPHVPEEIKDRQEPRRPAARTRRISGALKYVIAFPLLLKVMYPFYVADWTRYPNDMTNLPEDKGISDKSVVSHFGILDLWILLRRFNKAIVLGIQIIAYTIVCSRYLIFFFFPTIILPFTLNDNLGGSCSEDYCTPRIR